MSVDEIRARLARDGQPIPEPHALSTAIARLLQSRADRAHLLTLLAERDAQIAAAIDLASRAITLHYSNHPTYGNTTACGGGIGGSTVTAHCAYLCDNPAHNKERTGWDDIRAEYDRITALDAKGGAL